MIHSDIAQGECNCELSYLPTSTILPTPNVLCFYFLTPMTIIVDEYDTWKMLLNHVIFNCKHIFTCGYGNMLRGFILNFDCAKFIIY